ncbi:S-methyl-5-thioribose-1-phosphate isomerase [Sulfobacillus harzensis]|uniref:S-methyl-5-thioribose-1-phosphate isomerase n=1 Tax=Sulfobacillus harzensis TaxID=2729629 RepID=UPI003B82EB01
MEPIRPTADAVEILDQRALPERMRYIRCTRADMVVDAIQSLAVRGAPAIAVAGLYGLWVEALALAGHTNGTDELEAAKDRIRNARPTAVNLAWAVDKVWATRPGEGSALVRYLRREADALYQEESLRNERMAQFGAALLPPSSRVLTHCNTGSLATIGLGTALGVIRQAYADGRIDQVWVDETRPLLQGSRLTAWELVQDGIPATLITDSMAASLMAQGKVDAVLVGADRIAANGDTANKIGTYGLAVLAHFHHIPFYVVAPLSTIDRTLSSGNAIPIEERAAHEVREIRGQAIAPRDMPVFNPAFDVTPSSLISAIVTDTGVAQGDFETGIAKLLEQEGKGTPDA